MPSTMAYRTHFGSWGNAIREIGLEPKKPTISEQCKEALENRVYKKGEESTHWKGGRFKRDDGYIYIWNSELQKYEREHRVIMEKYLGRKLRKNEDIYHKNGIKDDNRIENLELLTKTKHTQLHEDKDSEKHKRKNRSECVYPNCRKMTSSKYGLCTEHYRSQWGRLKNGTINNLLDFDFKEFRHTEETKKKLSEIAKKQKRKDGKFS